MLWCVPPAEEQDQREGAGGPEPGRGVCPPRPGLLREPLRPLSQLETPGLRVTTTVHTYTMPTATTAAAVNNSSVQFDNLARQTNCSDGR